MSKRPDIQKFYQLLERGDAQEIDAQDIEELLQYTIYIEGLYSLALQHVGRIVRYVPPEFYPSLPKPLRNLEEKQDNKEEDL